MTFKIIFKPYGLTYYIHYNSIIYKIEKGDMFERDKVETLKFTFFKDKIIINKIKLVQCIIN